MPIYEFKCLKCNEFIELLVMNKDDDVELKCPACSGEDLERVLSSTNYSVGRGAGPKPSAKAITKTCGSGTCTTYEIPGPSK
jgi:putative FmdB family regulatory protein